MRRSIKYWEQNQIIWYLEVIIHAINADQEINPTEVDFFSKALKLVEEHADRKRLLGLLESESTKLERPPAIGQEELAWVLKQITLLLISDYEFTKEESDILAELSYLFGFSDTFFTQIMDWCNEGLAWKKKQLLLVEETVDESSGMPPDISVPIYIMEQDQLLWYAKVLVASIVIDGVVGQEEVDLFKRVIVFVKDKQEMSQLVTCLKKKIKPILNDPPEISEGILRRIFIEVITHFVLNQQFDENEHSFVKNLAKYCGFSDQLVQEAANLWDEGKNWVADGERIILKVNG